MIVHDPVSLFSYQSLNPDECPTDSEITEQIIIDSIQELSSTSAAGPDGVPLCCCCLPTPMTLASGGSPMFPHVVHQPASPSIWPAVQSLRRGLSTNPGVTMWCVCGCS